MNSESNEEESLVSAVMAFDSAVSRRIRFISAPNNGWTHQLSVNNRDFETMIPYSEQQETSMTAPNLAKQHVVPSTQLRVKVCVLSFFMIS
jgi:hypothetical protein